MDIAKTDEGKLVVLSLKPDWGPGKIMKVDGKYVYVRFKNKPDLELVKYAVMENPLSLAENQTDPVLARIRMGARPRPDRKKEPRVAAISFEQARELFLEKYPGKFDDPQYIGNLKKGERLYKLQAVNLYQELFGNGQLRQMLENTDVKNLAEKTEKIIGEQNLAFHQETLRFKDVLKVPELNLQYFKALADLLDDPEVRTETMIPYFEAVKAAPVAGFAKWTNATLLPYFAQPARHLFLKPRVTRDFAEMLGYDLKYDAVPNWTTYEALLGMAKDCKEKLADWNPRDYIDIQSFIWVVEMILKTPIAPPPAAEAPAPAGEVPTPASPPLGV